MKAKRQQEILRIIEKIDVETQDQLLMELRAQGVQATQATISRDIKELHLVKEPVGNGTYRYTQAAGKQRQNIVVIKTMPGLASAAAAALDGMEIDGFVGSLAGDDTAILIMRTNDAASRFCSEIHEMLQ